MTDRYPTKPFVRVPIERPILFSAPMVRALLAGNKTQTRRVVKPQPPEFDHATRQHQRILVPRCPYGQPGDRLWVREAFMHEPADYCWEASVSIPCRPAHTVYRADFPECDQPQRGVKWSPSIHMPRALSRIDLEITAVRVERLWQISLSDVRAEGCPHPAKSAEAAGWYRSLWEQINGAGAWAANPFVWVIEFKRV